MGGKYTETVYLPRVEEELLKIFGKKIIVGPAAAEGSELAIYAASNEFGAEIKPKKGRFLAVPLRKELKGISPRSVDGLEFIPPRGSRKNPVLARREGNRPVTYYLLLPKVTIPERSYLRSTIDSQDAIDKAMNLASAAIGRIIAGSGRADDVLHAIGNSLVSSVKMRIRSSIDPPNSGITLAVKKGSVTLVDETRLISSLSYEVL